MKTCFKCRLEKPIESFYKHPRMSDGRLGKCKECAKVDTVTNRASRLEYYQAYDRARGKYKERIAQNLRRNRAEYATNPAKIIARQQVSNCIRDGKMKKQPCSVCGSENAQAHHTDYSKPLDVVWLCTVHHFKQHRKYDYDELLKSRAAINAGNTNGR